MPRPSEFAATETINFRASREQKDLFDRAAARLGKTRTEFLIDSARAAAEETLLDQRLFLVEEADFQAFHDLLDEPVAPNAALKDLLRKTAPWDK